MNQVTRYDAEAAKRILNMLRADMPEEYALLMAQLKSQAGLAGLGQVETEESTSWWGNLIDLGTQTLTTIATYKLQREENREGQISRLNRRPRSAPSPET